MEDVKIILRLLPLISVFGIIMIATLCLATSYLYMPTYRRAVQPIHWITFCPSCSWYRLQFSNYKLIISECYAEQAWPIMFILVFLYVDCISWICHLSTLSALYMYRLYNKNKEFMENLNWNRNTNCAYHYTDSFDLISRHKFLNNECNSAIQCIF